MMSEEIAKIDIGFTKEYLDSCIKLESQKRIAEETFDRLTREEDQWKKEMAYTAKKERSSFSFFDMLITAGKGFGIWFVIFIVAAIIFSCLDIGYTFIGTIIALLGGLAMVAALFYFVIVGPIHAKVADYKYIRDKFAFDQQKERNIKLQGNNALYVIQNNKEKLRQAYRCACSNLENAYSANVLYKKYQTVEACAAIYDYLESGRCYTLEGPHGAYNKYDDELAKGIIISRLEEINTKLDVVILNQEKTYYIVREIESNVNEMKQNISNVCNSLQEANGKLDEIANSTKITTWATSVIATQVPDWRDEARSKANRTYA